MVRKLIFHAVLNKNRSQKYFSKILIIYQVFDTQKEYICAWVLGISSEKV